MQSDRMETVGPWVDEPVDHVGGQDMSGIWIGITEEKCHGHGREGVVVGECIFEELHRFPFFFFFFLFCQKAVTS